MHIIDTARLRLRPLEASDRDLYCGIYTDPELMRFVAPALSRDQAPQHFERIHAGMAPARWLFWVMQARSDNADIGLAGLIMDPASPDDSAEVGTMMLKRWHGRGYAEEAMRGVMCHAFSVMRLKSLYGKHPTQHDQSTRLMTKLGFTRRRAEHPEPEILWELDNPQTQRQCP